MLLFPIALLIGGCAFIVLQDVCLVVVRCGGVETGYGALEVSATGVCPVTGHLLVEVPGAGAVVKACLVYGPRRSREGAQEGRPS